MLWAASSNATDTLVTASLDRPAVIPFVPPHAAAPHPASAQPHRDQDLLLRVHHARRRERSADGVPCHRARLLRIKPVRRKRQRGTAGDIGAGGTRVGAPSVLGRGWTYTGPIQTFTWLAV